MNEEKLKKIWQTDQAAPAIDFAGLYDALTFWRDKLRRKIRIDIGMQVFFLAITLVLVLFYPKLFFMFWFGVALAAWYIWEIIRLYRRENEPAPAETAKQFLTEEFLNMKSLIRRTRFVAYFIPLILVPAGYYALDYFDNASLTIRDKILSVLLTIALTELICAVLMEIYFRIFYSGAVKELKDLLRQLDSDD
jgi:hypothetical protein